MKKKRSEMFKVVNVIQGISWQTLDVNLRLDTVSRSGVADTT